MSAYFAIEAREGRTNTGRGYTVHADVTAETEDMKAMAHNVHTLLAEAKKVQHNLLQGNITLADVGAFSKAIDGADMLATFVDSVCGLLPPSAEPIDASARIAQKVFDTPELLENILTLLKPRELLDAQPTSRTFNDAINTSPMLQATLGLRRHPIGHYGSIFDDEVFQFCGLTFNPCRSHGFQFGPTGAKETNTMHV